jgi:hypothetical protein
MCFTLYDPHAIATLVRTGERVPRAWPATGDNRERSTAASLARWPLACVADPGKGATAHRGVQEGDREMERTDRFFDNRAGWPARTHGRKPASW